MRNTTSMRHSPAKYKQYIVKREYYLNEAQPCKIQTVQSEKHNNTSVRQIYKIGCDDTNYQFQSSNIKVNGKSTSHDIRHSISLIFEHMPFIK